MSKLKFLVIADAFTQLLFLVAIACHYIGNTAPSTIAVAGGPKHYSWFEVTCKADYPQGYNYPVFVMKGKMWALQHDGGWYSADGKNWQKTDLPSIGLNSAFQRYVQFKDAIYALGTMQGNYLNMKLTSRIARTKDFKTWETLAEKSELPARVFYGATVFKDKIWMIGGWDGKRNYNDVWNSEDAVRWTKVADNLPWSARNVTSFLVFQDKLWLIGGNDVWHSEDGAHWTRATERMAQNPVHVGAYSAAVFDNKIWLAGVNRNGEFKSNILFSEDGVRWQEMKAPWSPRGAVALWVFDGKLYLTGGKSSYVENGETKFVYSNDVWYMTAKSK